ncbi:MAG: hypothetical protein BZY88_14690 [SAR202 cluster bacterium Io17-Chloro-G9]|nr:MAG: hypothetical protein BZY88_14690 [SAR202 cluster bacterium Io17-Chloro-G9]
MARPLDLDKVKQAWDLRRQGKQQKEIAGALDLSLRHTQNYLSLDWLSQRSLRSLAKGAADEVNDQMKVLWSLGHKSPSEQHEINGFSNGNGDSHEGDAETEECPAPENWPDVAQLEDWGIPRVTAPGMLGAWRRAHREGLHEVCRFWLDLTDNVQTGMPFDDAFDLTTACWFADRWDVGVLRTIAEVFRLYRPWEGKVNRKVYLAEVKDALGEKLNGSVATDFAAVHGLPRRFVQGTFKSNEDDD